MGERIPGHISWCHGRVHGNGRCAVLPVIEVVNALVMGDGAVNMEGFMDVVEFE